MLTINTRSNTNIIFLVAIHSILEYKFFVKHVNASATTKGLLIHTGYVLH